MRACSERHIDDDSGGTTTAISKIEDSVNAFAKEGHWHIGFLESIYPAYGCILGIDYKKIDTFQYDEKENRWIVKGKEMYPVVWFGVDDTIYPHWYIAPQAIEDKDDNCFQV